ncbi:MAG: hypothetical protein WCO56_00585 [Verrucomicrobiota bacterium]
MNYFIRTPILFLTLLTLASVAQAQTEESGTISKNVDPSTIIPITVSGFSGEVDITLKFDLEVMGCVLVDEQKSLYTVSGTYNGRLEGFLNSTKGKSRIFGKAYSGNSPRTEAHAFADDIIQALRNIKGIAQTRMAFKFERGPVREIFMGDYDGHNLVQITHDQSNANAPTWGPGQHSIFYCSYKQNYPAIYSQELSSGKRAMVAGFGGSNISPAVSSNGRVAMILSKGGSPNLYISDASGGNLKQLTNTREGESCPCWSPDGRTICFVSRSSGRAALYTIPAAGGQMQRLSTAGVLNATEPDWSPDGKYIVFTSQMGSFQICVIPAAGGEAKVLTEGQDPSWAPNSRTVLYVKGLERGNGRLSLLDVPTKRTKDWPSLSGSASQPAWAR